MTASLKNAGQSIITGNASIVIVENLMALTGGRTLDTTGYTPASLPEGTVIIKETSSGTYKPMPLNGGATAYASLPTGHTYEGILIADIPTTRPFAALLQSGKVNVVAAPYGLATSAILANLKAALPLIIFTQD